MTNLDLIKQYADTGAILPEYQFSKLNSNLQGTYLRRRILQAKESAGYYDLHDYEFHTMQKTQLIDYLKNIPTLSNDRYESIPKELRIYHLNALVEHNKTVHIDRFREMPEWLHEKFIKLRSNYDLSSSFFEILSDKVKSVYVKSLVDREYIKANWWHFPYLPDDYKIKYIEKGGHLRTEDLLNCSEELRHLYFDERLNKGRALYDGDFEIAPDEYKLRSIRVLLRGYDKPQLYHMKWAPKELKIQFLETGYQYDDEILQHLDEVGLTEFYLTVRLQELAKAPTTFPSIGDYEFARFNPKVMKVYLESFPHMIKRGVPNSTLDQMDGNTIKYFLRHQIEHGGLLSLKQFRFIKNEVDKREFLIKRINDATEPFDLQEWEIEEIIMGTDKILRRKYVLLCEEFYTPIMKRKGYISPHYLPFLPKNLKDKYGY